MATQTDVQAMTTEERQRAIAIAQQLAQEFDRVGAEHDRDNTFAHELVQPFKDSGLPALNVPKRFGGWGADLLTTARCVEELAKGDPACALAFNMHIGVIGFFRGMWSEEDQERFFTRVAERGDIFDGAYSEERAGVIGLADTVAVPVSGGYKVSGRKSWATLSLAADFHSFNVTITDPDGEVPQDPGERGSREVMMVCPADAPGVRIDKTWDSMGMRATGTETVVFEDVFVPEEDVVARDFRPSLFANLEWQTLTFASVYLGLARKAYAATKQTLIKKSLGAVQGAADVRVRDLGYVQTQLAEMLVTIEGVAASIEATGRAVMEGRDADWGPIMRLGMLEVPKVLATEGAMSVVNTGMRLVGGGSFRRGHLLERLYRDARSGPFHPLTTDQTLDYIGKAELGLLG